MQMSTSYLTFFYSIVYATITNKTNESIPKKCIEANLDSINGIIIAISFVMMNSMFSKKYKFQGHAWVYKVLIFFTKSHFLQVTTT